MNVLITGGTRGIGLGIAIELAKNGHNLSLNGVRKVDDVESTIEKIRAFGTEVIYCEGDISKSQDRNNILQKTLKHFDTVQCLINNAGVAPEQRTDILETTEDSFDRVMNINLKGAFFLTQQVAKHMIRSQKSAGTPSNCIINISSISAIVASPNRSEYCLSKAGMSMMTKLYATKLGDQGIMVYEIQPGIIETDMTAEVLGKYKDKAEKGLIIQPRIGQPEDVGKAVSSLLEGKFPYSTGQVLTVDGGLTIQRL